MDAGVSSSDTKATWYCGSEADSEAIRAIVLGQKDMGTNSVFEGGCVETVEDTEKIYLIAGVSTSVFLAICAAAMRFKLKRRRLAKVAAETRKSTRAFERQKSGRLFDEVCSSVLVDGKWGLSELPLDWRAALVPKATPAGAALLKDLAVGLRVSLEAPWHRWFCCAMTTPFSTVLASQGRNFFATRRQMYAKTLVRNPSAIRQIVAVLHKLEQLYKTSYDAAFERLEALHENRTALAEWTDWVQGQPSRTTATQGGGGQPLDVFKSGVRVQKQFDEFCRSILAEVTAADALVKPEYVTAPLKSPFRAAEKRAMTPGVKPSDIFRFDTIFDIVRGALNFADLRGMVRAVQEIARRREVFTILRIKNRLTRSHPASARATDCPTPSGWRDMLINGFFTDDPARHIVEIQIHHADLVLIREKSGGHDIYAFFRALREALEITSADNPEVAVVAAEAAAALAETASVAVTEQTETATAAGGPSKTKAEKLVRFCVDAGVSEVWADRFKQPGSILEMIHALQAAGALDGVLGQLGMPAEVKDKLVKAILEQKTQAAV